MKAKSILIFIITIMISLISCSNEEKINNTEIEQTPKAEFHIALITGTILETPEAYKASEELVSKYGDASNNGYFYHIVLPENYDAQVETNFSEINRIANDSILKAIVMYDVNNGCEPTFNIIKENHPQILLYAVQSHEEILAVESFSDLAVNINFEKQGTRLANKAKELGAKAFVHISFTQDMYLDHKTIRQNTIKSACENLGLEFISATCPSPFTRYGQRNLNNFFEENFKKWIEQYGNNVAFFCSDNSIVDTLFSFMKKDGGIFIEQDIPSPLASYPKLLNINTNSNSINFDSINEKIATAIKEQNINGEYGTWKIGAEYSMTKGIGELAYSVAKGEATISKVDDVLKALNTYHEGWEAEFLIDQATGIRSKNHILINQNGFMFN